jgi:hypothetical protein
MTPESLSREGSPTPDSYPDSTISSPVIHGTHLEVKTSQSAPGSPGHPGKKRLCHHIYESLTNRRNVDFPYPPPSVLFIIHNINSCMLLSCSSNIVCNLYFKKSLRL